MISFGFWLTINFLSRKIRNKDLNYADIQININWKAYVVDNKVCKSVKIQNWRLVCYKDINGEEVAINWIILQPDLKWSANITYSITIDDESNTKTITKIPFVFSSKYSYKLNGVYVNDIATKKDFNEKFINGEESVNQQLQKLKNDYLTYKDLVSLPLNDDNTYCNTGWCNYQHVVFLEKDPKTKKINLDLLIYY